MQRALDSSRHKAGQDEFALRVKVALLRKKLTLTALAEELGLSRNTVSLAVNRGLYQPTRKRIAKHLRIKL